MQFGDKVGLFDKRSALITGGAGFIGSHLVDRLLDDGWHITVVDNFDPFYDERLKRENIKHHISNDNYRLVEKDILDWEFLISELDEKYDVLIHLAARAGVRPSIKDPVSYQRVNVEGTQNMLEIARNLDISQFIFASSSSVYGINSEVPWSEETFEFKPISPYASTKLSSELLGHVYSKLYGIRFLALRFFTVFGPRQRPDLAIHKFVQLISNNKPVQLFGDGSTRRDYTYVSDIVSGICSAIKYESSLYEVINLGNNRTVSLAELISAIEKVMGVEAIKKNMPEQPGDVPQTWASIKKAEELLGYAPSVELYPGLEAFYSWYTSFVENSKVS